MLVGSGGSPIGDLCALTQPTGAYTDTNPRLEQQVCRPNRHWSADTLSAEATVAAQSSNIGLPGSPPVLVGSGGSPIGDLCALRRQTVATHSPTSREAHLLGHPRSEQQGGLKDVPSLNLGPEADASDGPRAEALAATP